MRAKGSAEALGTRRTIGAGLLQESEGPPPNAVSRSSTCHTHRQFFRLPLRALAVEQPLAAAAVGGSERDAFGHDALQEFVPSRQALLNLGCGVDKDVCMAADVKVGQVGEDAPVLVRLLALVQQEEHIDVACAVLVAAGQRAKQPHLGHLRVLSPDEGGDLPQLLEEAIPLERYYPDRTA